MQGNISIGHNGELVVRDTSEVKLGWYSHRDPFVTSAAPGYKGAHFVLLRQV
jgi:hypothetical protein